MRVKVGAGLTTMFAIVALWITAGGDPGGVPCTRTVTPATLSAAVGEASTGNVLCLATGDYGTWGGTNKAITLRAKAGATPTMAVFFGTGDTGFTVDGMRGMNGVVGTGASDITIRDSTFNGTIVLGYGGDVDNISLIHNKLTWPAGPSFGTNGKIILDNTLSGTLASPSVTIRDNVIANGDLDGIHIGGGSPGAQIVGNEFSQICDASVAGPPESNHTDQIQFESGQQIRIAGNWIHADADCPTQGITSFDGGTIGVIIEDNVVDIRRPWGIELYSDTNSIVRHNTIRYYPDADCFFTGPSCGKIALSRKPADPPGSGTQVYDNVMSSVEIDMDSTGTEHNNLCHLTCTGDGSTSNQVPIFRAGANPTSRTGFCLALGSPGRGTASDSLDAGIRC